MAKVVAKVRGYFGGMIREPGAIFDVPGDQKAPSWTRPHASGSDADGSKTAETLNTGGSVVIPADWRDRRASERKALAKAITGEAVPHAADADRIIESYMETSKPEPFGDAPEPETAKGNGMAEALGGMQPDWVAPSDDI